MSLQTLVAVAALGVAGTVGAGLGGWFAGHHAGWQERDDKAVSDQAQADRDHLAAMLEKSRRLAIADHGAQSEAAKKLDLSRRATAGAVAELDRLRVVFDEAQQFAAGDAAAACGSDAATKGTRQLLFECASSYQELAGEAGDLAARLGGLQQWVTGVCTQ